MAPADFSSGGLNRGAVNNPDKTEQYGTGAAAMVFLYVVVFSSSWLMIPFIYPTEILPTRLRAKGNAFGVAVWAVGYGAGSLLVPVMIAGIHEKVSCLLSFPCVHYWLLLRRRHTSSVPPCPPTSP